jgi:hypothetical protein
VAVDRRAPVAVVLKRRYRRVTIVARSPGAVRTFAHRIRGCR